LWQAPARAWNFCSISRTLHLVYITPSLFQWVVGSLPLLTVWRPIYLPSFVHIPYAIVHLLGKYASSCCTATRFDIATLYSLSQVKIRSSLVSDMYAVLMSSLTGDGGGITAPSGWHNQVDKETANLIRCLVNGRWWKLLSLFRVWYSLQGANSLAEEQARIVNEELLSACRVQFF
jgi:hypothetical protein